MAHTAIVTPYFVGMMQEPPCAIFVIDRIVDVLFMTDMGLKFIVAYRSNATGGTLSLLQLASSSVLVRSDPNLDA